MTKVNSTAAGLLTASLLLLSCGRDSTAKPEAAEPLAAVVVASEATPAEKNGAAQLARAEAQVPTVAIPQLQRFEMPKAEAVVGDFDFERWTNAAGKRVDLKTWTRYNPRPWTNYYSAKSVDCAKRWYVNLGPLGVPLMLKAIFSDLSKIGPPIPSKCVSSTAPAHRI